MCSLALLNSARFSLRAVSTTKSSSYPKSSTNVFCRNSISSSMPIFRRVFLCSLRIVKASMFCRNMVMPSMTRRKTIELEKAQYHLSCAPKQEQRVPIARHHPQRKTRPIRRGKPWVETHYQNKQRVVRPPTILATTAVRFMYMSFLFVSSITEPLNKGGTPHRLFL